MNTKLPPENAEEQTANQNAENTPQNGNIPYQNGTVIPKPPPGERRPPPLIPAAGVAVPQDTLKYVFELRRRMAEDPLSVPLELWVWEQEYKIAHPGGRPIQQGRKYRLGPNGALEAEETNKAIEKAKGKKKSKVLREMAGVLKVAVKRLDTREKNELSYTTLFVNQMSNLINSLIEERKSDIEARKNLYALMQEAAGQLPADSPLKKKILTAVEAGLSLFAPKLAQLAGVKEGDVPEVLGGTKK